MEPFRHPLRVRFQECDPQGVVYFSRYAEYFDIGLTELWRERLGPYGDMVGEGYDMVVAELQVRYFAPALFDELVDVVLETTRVGETSVTFACRVERDGERLVEGSVRHVFIDPPTKTKTPMPDRVRAALT
jgi:acyl-CoA thioester hydrolase